MKRNIRKLGKNGSYTVEAALTLPIFIIAVISLALIINIIAICESICFNSAKEIRAMTLEAEIVELGILTGPRVENAVLGENPKLKNFVVRDVDYLYSHKEVDDLIGIKTGADFSVSHPLGVMGKISFDFNLLARGFTGAVQKRPPLDEARFKEGGNSHTVIVFPKYGERYHKENCRYVKQEYYGEEYKVPMEAEEAKNNGYTPCMICGG